MDYINVRPNADE